MLTDPVNGTIDCSLGQDGVPSFEDVCTYNLSCNTGYESDTRTCQSDGTWSGTDMCIRGNDNEVHSSLFSCTY